MFGLSSVFLQTSATFKGKCNIQHVWNICGEPLQICRHMK